MNILYVNSLEANNKELARQLASANVLIAEQNKLAKERQEWALHTNEVIRSLNQQLSAALAACNQKDEALKWLMDWQVKHVDVWDNPAFDNAEEALAIQPDDMKDVILCHAEPVGYVFQHEDTGRTMCVEAQQVEWNFEKNNPRLFNTGPLYRAWEPK